MKTILIVKYYVSYLYLYNRLRRSWYESNCTYFKCV